MPTVSASVDVTLLNPQHVSRLGLRALRSWLIARLPQLVDPPVSLTVRLTSDVEVKRLNRSWRGIDRATDVLSFPGERTPEGRHLGDIVIGLPTAARQAREAGHSRDREIRELILHGLLHCLGYDHETDNGTMNRLERKLRREWIEVARSDD